MEGKFKLEQLWRWQHEDAPEDTLGYFPEAEVSVMEISKILDPEPPSAVSLDDVEWLLLHHRGKFTLFMRGYQEPEDRLTDNQLGIHYLDLLRYEPAENHGANAAVWRLDRIKDLDSMSNYYKSRWRNRAVLVIREGDNPGEHSLQILCEEPTGPAAYCLAYCCPPERPIHMLLGRLFRCNLVCPLHWT